MTSARERAVEAGARAASPHAFNDVFWLSRKAPGHHQRHARENARNHAEAVLRAAFPILAEEVLNAANAYTKEQYGYGFLGHPVDRARIVARIEQMKEITE